MIKKLTCTCVFRTELYIQKVSFQVLPFPSSVQLYCNGYELIYMPLQSPLPKSIFLTCLSLNVTSWSPGISNHCSHLLDVRLLLFFLIGHFKVSRTLWFVILLDNVIKLF